VIVALILPAVSGEDSYGARFKTYGRIAQK